MDFELSFSEDLSDREKNEVQIGVELMLAKALAPLMTNRNADTLTDEEKDEFVEHFYNFMDGSDVFLEDGDCPAPWGCPWYWQANYMLTGINIRDMARNHFLKHIDEIASQIASDNC